MGRIIDINSASLSAEKRKQQEGPVQDAISLVSLDTYEKNYMNDILTKFEMLKKNIAHFNEAVSGIEMVSGVPQKNIPNIDAIEAFLQSPMDGSYESPEFELINQSDKDGNLYRAVMQIVNYPDTGAATAMLITKEAGNGDLFCYTDRWEKMSWEDVFGCSRMQQFLLRNGVPVSEMVKAALNAGKSVSDEEVIAWDDRYKPLLELYGLYADDCCFAYTERKEGPFILMPRATNKLGPGIGMTKDGFVLYQFIPDFVMEYLNDGPIGGEPGQDHLLQVDSIDRNTAEKIIVQRYCRNMSDDDDIMMYVPVSADIFVPLFANTADPDSYTKFLDDMHLSEKDCRRVSEYMQKFIESMELYT